jgi:2-(1,2-epoxy-1,2-dihydrophenyl)acetyl-CoA isomerase
MTHADILSETIQAEKGRERNVNAVIVERREDVALLRLNQPQTMNALSPAIKQGLEMAVPQLMADSAVRCIVITGTDKAFCAGGDISNMADRSAPSVRARMHPSHGWVKLLLEGEKPVIAAVNGAAAGAGFSLAMMCDFVILADTAYFKAGFPGLGAAPDLGLALTLPRAIGMLRAKDILMTNRRVGAEEAVAMGMATRVVPVASLLEEAITLAQSLAAGPATSLGLTKHLLNQAYAPIAEFLSQEAMTQAIAFGSDEFGEGVAAFLGKRKPQFRPGSK